MNKTEMIAKVAEKLDTTKKLSAEIVDAVVDTIVEELVAGGEVNITKFGKFSVVHKDATSARNPMTGATIEVPAKNVPKFKFSSVVKEAVK